MLNEAVRRHRVRPGVIMPGAAGRAPVPRSSRHVFITLFVLVLRGAQAQSPSDPLITPDYALPDLSRNEILLPGDHKVWEGLNERFDRLFLEGEGQVNIVQIGGSHIQADAWTARLRDRLQRVVPGTRAGRGFIFPYNMAGTNTPYWYLPEYTGRWSAMKNTQRPDSTIRAEKPLSAKKSG